jgi:hypothetical protein
MSAERERTTSDPIVRLAVENLHRHVAALSASEIVQLILFPESFASWSTGAGVDESQVANLFRRHRTYVRLRSLLADRLGVPVAILSHLIDADPAVPMARRPPGFAEILAAAGIHPVDDRPAIDWRSPPYPRYREGTNPLERLALANLDVSVPAMPASRIVGFALWPESLAGFAARSKRFTLGSLLTALSGQRRSDGIETALSRRLGVRRQELDAFIAATKRDPLATTWPEPVGRQPAGQPPVSGQ